MVSQQSQLTQGDLRVCIVTQTRVQKEHEADFASWQMRLGDVIERAPGFIDGKVLPPSPPVQLDWVLVQRFTTQEHARHWLLSPERTALIGEVRGWLEGLDDVHLFEEEEGARAAQPVSAIIATHVTPGSEAKYREWQQRIAIAQTRFAGFQGYKLQPPTPGIHDDWVTILRFDTQEHLDAWFASAERQQLLKEAESYTGETHIRTVLSGFDGWFAHGDTESPVRPIWKQNMSVLLALYPVVFLFGKYVADPLFGDELGLPFCFSLFLSNVASVIILSIVMPRISAALDWWLAAKPATRRVNLIGAALVVSVYAVLMAIFSFV